MSKNSRCTQRDLDKQGIARTKLDGRIKTIKATLEGLRMTPPALGGKWRDGMIRYYTEVLEELEVLHSHVR